MTCSIFVENKWIECSYKEFVKWKYCSYIENYGENDSSYWFDNYVHGYSVNEFIIYFEWFDKILI